MTQNEKILAFLKENGSITQRDAVMLGCYRLSARIFDLKEQGVKIITESETKGKSTYARYRLGE